jgi:hypothetical protein
VVRAAAPRRPAPPPKLPRGGREIFPRYRVVAFYGAPQAAALGVLGVGTPDAAAHKLATQARAYARGGRPVLPALELIATVASGAPHGDGRYRYRQSRTTIVRYLAAARRAHALLLLDVQPGRASFMSEVRLYRPFLAQPDVSLALDPEWHVGPGQIPGKELGSVDASEVNRVSAYLAGIVRAGRLPQKLLVVHQFTESMIRNKQRLVRRPGIALTINVDGVGGPADKLAKYDLFAQESPRLHRGIKLFYTQDTGLLSPHEVLALRPRPELVVYQ